jgi:Ca2+-transporting ATPase
VAAVEEGRVIYNDIKKNLTFSLSRNVAEILLLGMAAFIGWPLPLVALQIVWVNLTTDGLPALAPVFYVYWQTEGVATAQTMTFVTLILFELFFAHGCRSMPFTVLQLGPFGNKWLWLATLGSAAMTLLVLYIPSWAQAFHVVPLWWQDWAVALSVSGAGFVLVKAGKWVAARRRGAATAWEAHRIERDTPASVVGHAA